MKKFLVAILMAASVMAAAQRINVQDFGVLPDGKPHEAEWEKAKKAGSVMYFPAGTYMSGTNGWRVLKDNITIEGDGPGITILATPEGTDAKGLELSTYRRGGWDVDKPIAYTDNLKIGQKWLDLTDNAQGKQLKAGDKIFITAGASYYDQEFGEFNIVERIAGGRVYLVYSLARPYSYQTGNWNGLLQKEIVSPKVGGTVVANITNPPSLASKFVSLNNDLFQITAASGTTITLKRLYASGESKYPAGTKVFKGRAIYLTPASSQNVQVRNLTIIGRRTALSISNSINSRFDNVEVRWEQGASAGGLWLDGDDGRFATFTNCTFRSQRVFGSQPARSFGGLGFYGCTFINTTVNFSEFNDNNTVDGCTFFISDSAITGNQTAISIGWTTGNTRITNNTIYAENISYGISSFPDINGRKSAWGGSIIIKDNVLNLKGVTAAIAPSVGPGIMEVSGNKIFGSCQYLFGLGNLYISPDGTSKDGILYMPGTYQWWHHNFVSAAFDGVTNNVVRNTVFEDNYIHQLSESVPGGNNSVRANGNIIRSTGTITPADSVNTVIFRRNTFVNFRYQDNSFNYKGPVGANVDISDNNFIGNTGPGNKGAKQFSISPFKKAE